MQAADRRRSLLDLLGSVPDLRGGQGRRYPMVPLLAVLILPAMNGQSPLQGMWPWARAHAQLPTARLSFHRQRVPALEAFNAWLAACDAERISPATVTGVI